MKSILLLHGALGAKSQLEPLKKLLQSTFDVHTLNFEGHGDRSTEKAYSMDLFAQNLKDYLDQHKLKNILVFGYSMGGYVALKLAQKHPAYFEKIITLGTKFNWTPESAAAEVKMLDATKIQEKVPAFAQALSTLHTAIDWKIVLQKTAAMMLDLGNGKAMADTDFSAIQTTCYIGVGDRDAMVSREETEHVAGLIPNASFYLLENTIHPIDKLDFERVVKLIEEKTP
ncbi:MAG: alpha/beta hydrolase [Bacteroidetes bacterium]|nr:alpha/beta hydrolase [Bacteroidota bacterium]